MIIKGEMVSCINYADMEFHTPIASSIDPIIEFAQNNLLEHIVQRVLYRYQYNCKHQVGRLSEPPPKR